MQNWAGFMSGMHCIKGAVSGFKQLLIWDHTGSMAACFPLVSAQSHTWSCLCFDRHSHTQMHTLVHAHMYLQFSSIEALSCKAKSWTFSGSTEIKVWSTGANASHTINILYSLLTSAHWLHDYNKCHICGKEANFFVEFAKFSILPSISVCVFIEGLGLVWMVDKNNIHSGLMLLRGYAALAWNEQNIETLCIHYLDIAD